MKMQKKTYGIFLWVAFITALLTGCGGREDIYLIKYSRVQEGVSTKHDVLALYGRPKFVLPRRDGSEQWSYEADSSGNFSDIHYNFDFNFDKNGVVTHKSRFTSKWP